MSEITLKNLENDPERSQSKSPDMVGTRLEEQRADNLAQTSESTENEVLKSRVKSLTAQLAKAREDSLQWQEECVKLRGDVSDVSYQNAQLENENAKLSIVSAEEMRALTSIDAIRDEANERIKEERERHAHLIKEIQRASDIKVQHVEAASKALREQISQLQNSGDLTTTILTQTRETQDATQKMVNEANERVRKTEDERSRMILEQGHLSNQIADAQATKSADKEQLQRLTVSLEKATKTIELLERQQEKSQEKIKGYIEMEKQWQADKTAYGVVVTKYDELKGDCEFAIGRIGELKADKEALQQELDAEREARDELALGFEDI